jgi:multidrug efflux pump subunit AcrA (membrane-fusion protein)
MKENSKFIGAFCLVIVLLMTGCSGGGKSTDPGNPETRETETVYAVRTMTVEKRDIQEYLEVNGDVITETSVDIFPDMAGKLVKLNVMLGGAVKKGEVIAEIDPSKPGLAYALSPVKAPISGTVTSVSGKIGATVGTASVIAQVGQVDRIQVKTFIPEREIGKVRVGQSACVTFEAYPGRVYSARVSRLSPVVDPVTRTKEVRLSFLTTAENLSVGMFGRVRINTKLHAGRLVVPEDVVVRQDGKPAVFVLAGDGRVEKREIITGVSVDGVLEISGGLREGEIVVSEGQSLLEDGSKVRVVSPKENEV